MSTGLLVAEQDTELRRIYSALSSVLGFRVETAADALECWIKLRTRSPDALVVDAKLLWGGSDGVLACLQEDSDGIRVPAVFVTGDEPPEVLSERFGIPTRHCFQKPHHLTALLDSVSTVIAPRQFMARAG